MVKKITYLFMMLFLTTIVFAQDSVNSDDDYVKAEDDYVISFDSLKTKDKMHYSFAMGASFGHSSIYGDYFGTYYKPTISYDVSNRLTINTGLLYVNSSVHNFPVMGDYTYQTFSGNISQYYAFVGAQYKLTDKLSVGGSLFYDFSSYTDLLGAEFSGSNGIDNIGYSANFLYKVSKHLSIEGEIRLNDRSPLNPMTTPFQSQTWGMQQSFFGR